MLYEIRFTVLSLTQLPTNLYVHKFFSDLTEIAM